MKNFFTSLLGSLAALLIFSFCCFLLLVGLIGAVVSMGVSHAAATTEKIQSNSYLVYDFSSNVMDAPPGFDFGVLASDERGPIQLRTVTRAIRAAARDNRIAGILLKGSFKADGVGSGYAALREVRAALADFRAAGKPVKAYLESAETRDYYVASVANEVELDPFGLILMPGLASEPAFFAGALEKYGVGVQVTRVGKYKSFVEPFTRTDMSPEAREELQRLLDDMWASIVSDIAHSRKLSPDAIQGTVDAKGLIRPDDAKAAGLIDRIAYRDQVIDEIKADTGRSGEKGAFRQVSLKAYAELTGNGGSPIARGWPPAAQAVGGGRGIAVVYAEGDIVDGEGVPGEIGGVSFARELRKLRQDDSIRAVVLRVNSPGGSASAAEDVQREVRLLREVKPVIVSMGTYAASGGYWISAFGDRIFAEPTTITGSIGVFGIQFDIQKLAGDFGVTFDRVKTGKFADADTISRPKTPEEMAVIQNFVDWIYGQFVDKVAEGRKLPKERVEEIAQGRVWSGSEAVKLGLVDQLGSLSQAVQYAIQKGGLKPGCRIQEFPAPKTFREELQDMIGRLGPELDQSRSTGAIPKLRQRLDSELAIFKVFNDPNDVYARLPLDLSIR